MRNDLHALLDRFIEGFAEAVFTRAQERTGGASSSSSSGGRAKASARSGSVRMCPAPGCNKPGAGPRNRWFCRDHARSLPVAEQRRLLAAAHETSSGLTVSRRGGKRGGSGRKLDMSCRVAGCKNPTRGPRFGYICDKHRKELSAKEQQQAREQYKEAHSKAA